MLRPFGGGGLLLGPAVSLTPVTYQSAGAVGLSGLVPYPSGIQAGDGLLMIMYARDGGGNESVSAPTGWSLCTSGQIGLSGSLAFLAFAQAAGGESGNLDITPFCVGSLAINGWMTRFSKCSGFTNSQSHKDTGAGTTITMNTASASGVGDGALAVSMLLASATGHTIASSTGESNGDWAQIAGGYANGSDSTFGWQAAAMGGSNITGGSAALDTSAAQRICISTVLKAG